ncbi:hypothetical protein P8452_27167 [Trifolium repens]|nr:hypothetical protein P8452_27167 [Trifolium repens]
MAELRHSSSSLGSRATSSPMKRDAAADSSPLIPENDISDDRHSPKDRDRPLCSHFHYVSSFFTDDPRVPLHNSRISIFITLLLILVGLISLFTILHKLNSPYLCKKDGIVLHCPHVKESASLWENPYSSTTSWKPCAERRDGAISELPHENKTNGYIFIHAEGGLNQQRIAICNAVAVAKVMNATLILPVLKQDQIWKDQTKFEDIFDVDHFIDYLKDDVRIVRDIPEWFTDKTELFSSIRFDRFLSL